MWLMTLYANEAAEFLVRAFAEVFGDILWSVVLMVMSDMLDEVDVVV